MLIVHQVRLKILNRLEKSQFQIYRGVILTIRKYQDNFLDGCETHQKAYNDLDERSFNALYRELMIGFCKTLYWFCVANARFK